MTGLKPLHVLAILSILIATQAQAARHRDGEVAAACVTGQGPGTCSEPMLLYGAAGDHAGKRTASSPELYEPQGNEADKPRVGWPANMILG